MKTNFKNMIGIILSLVLVLGTFAGCASTNQPSDGEEGEKDLLARIQENGVLTIATEGSWSPWTYHDESGELVGLDIEIGKLIAEGLGVEAKFEETNWDSILAGV